MSPDSDLAKLDWNLLKDAFSFHYDCVPENTHPDLFVIGRSKACDENPRGILYCICHRFLPIYGIQSHPDGFFNTIKRCLERYDIWNTIDLYEPEKYNNIFSNFFQILM